MATIGFIGIGNMGAGMARNLVKAGHEVTVFDLDTEKARGIEGAHLAPTAIEAAQGRDAIVTMLPAGPVVASVYRETILPNAAPDTLLIDCSTIDVDTARQLAGEAAQAGFAMLDAPVSGGVAGADAGTLAFMTGGIEASFARAEPPPPSCPLARSPSPLPVERRAAVPMRASCWPRVISVRSRP